MPKLNQIPTNHQDFQAAMDAQIERARSALDVKLNPNDPELIHQVTLGNQWDDPNVLAAALDMQPLYYARWATMLRILRRQRDKVSQRYSVWESIVKDTIAKQIYNENIDKGMTANNARPVQQVVQDRFNSKYIRKGKNNTKEHTQYLEYKSAVDSVEEKIDLVEVIVKAFEMRANTLIALGHLVRTMIEKGFVVIKLPSSKTKH